VLQLVFLTVTIFIVTVSELAFRGVANRSSLEIVLVTASVVGKNK